MPDTDTLAAALHHSGMVAAALRLPYSIGSQRLLRELLSAVTGTPLPPDPPVQHGPVVPPRIPPRLRQAAAAERRETLIQALRAGPVTQGTAPYDWHLLVSDVKVLRDRGVPVRNVGTRRAARYVLDAHTPSQEHPYALQTPQRAQA